MTIQDLFDHFDDFKTYSVDALLEVFKKSEPIFDGLCKAYQDYVETLNAGDNSDAISIKYLTFHNFENDFAEYNNVYKRLYDLIHAKSMLDTNVANYTTEKVKLTQLDRSNYADILCVTIKAKLERADRYTSACRGYKAPFKSYGNF